MNGPSETRAEIARRRLDRLIAEFNAGTGGSVSEDEPDRSRVERTTSKPRLRQPPGRRVADRSTGRLTPPHVAAVGVVAVATLVAVGWWAFSGRPQSVPVDVTSPASMTSVVGPESSSADVVVDVVGHVRRPGIVQLPAGSRVNDAVEAAGGLTRDVDRATINLARQIVDGEQVLVGIEPAEPPIGGSPSGSTKINLNAADVSALDALPGVGPVTAQAIIDHRQDIGRFTSVDELIDVSGIGEATLAKLRELVTV